MTSARSRPFVWRVVASGGLAFLLLAMAVLPALANPAAEPGSPAPGAAAASAAAGPFRVVVDAGHGGQDPGASSPLQRMVEKDVVLRLALMTGTALQRQGVGVVYTRTNDRTVGLAERAALAQRTGAGALVSIHLNSAPSPLARGAEAWYGSSAGAADLAGAILNALGRPLQAHGGVVRGTFPGSNLVVLRTPVPAALVELGYLTNARDVNLLNQDVFLAAAADGIATGIIRFRDSRPAPSGAVNLASTSPFVPDTYFVKLGDTLQAIAQRFRLATDELAKLNPLVNASSLQSGQPLKLQPSAEPAPAPASAPTAAPAAAPVSQPARSADGDTYTVAPGDNLSRIAVAKGIAVQELMRLNGIQDPDLVQVGQTLRLRGGAAGTPPSRTQGTHTVAAGETLSGVAARYGVGVADLVRWNQLADAHSVRAGQMLRLAPSGSSEGTLTVPAMTGATAARRYQVQPGDTLSVVAARHNVSQDALIQANGLRNPDRLVAGTQLLIPASGTATRRTT